MSESDLPPGPWRTDDDNHLPSFAGSPADHDFGMLGDGLRHIGIVANVDGRDEVIATVWNHHHSSAAQAVASAIIHAEQVQRLSADGGAPQRIDPRLVNPNPPKVCGKILPSASGTMCWLYERHLGPCK